MTREIHVLVVEDCNSGNAKVSEMLSGEGVYVHLADSCENAMNKMLEYMDMIVVDSRVQSCTGKTLQEVKGRVATTPVIAVCPACDLDTVRLGIRAKADAYLALEMGGEGIRSVVLTAHAESVRANSSKRGRFMAAA